MSGGTLIFHLAILIIKIIIRCLPIDFISKCPLLNPNTLFEWQIAIPFITESSDASPVTVVAERFPLPVGLTHEIVLGCLSHIMLLWEVSLVVERVGTWYSEFTQQNTCFEGFS